MSRRLFVTHQQSIARRALTLGSVGAARAALRSLQPEDFADQDIAEEYLGTLRDSSASPDDTDVAIKRLICLDAAEGFLTPTPGLGGPRRRGTRSV